MVGRSKVQSVKVQAVLILDWLFVCLLVILSDISTVGGSRLAGRATSIKRLCIIGHHQSLLSQCNLFIARPGEVWIHPPFAVKTGWWHPRQKNWTSSYRRYLCCLCCHYCHPLWIPGMKSIVDRMMKTMIIRSDSMIWFWFWALLLMEEILHHCIPKIMG